MQFETFFTSFTCPNCSAVFLLTLSRHSTAVISAVLQNEKSDLNIEMLSSSPRASGAWLSIQAVHSHLGSGIQYFIFYILLIRQIRNKINKKKKFNKFIQNPTPVKPCEPMTPSTPPPITLFVLHSDKLYNY